MSPYLRSYTELQILASLRVFQKEIIWKKLKTTNYPLFILHQSKQVGHCRVYPVEADFFAIGWVKIRQFISWSSAFLANDLVKGGEWAWVYEDGWSRWSAKRCPKMLSGKMSHSWTDVSYLWETDRQKFAIRWVLEGEGLRSAPIFGSQSKGMVTAFILIGNRNKIWSRSGVLVRKMGDKAKDDVFCMRTRRDTSIAARR